MPILDVEMVSERAEAGLAQRLADAAAEAWRLGPAEVWVRLRCLPVDRHAENGGAPGDVRPVFVSVLRARVPDGERLAEDVRSLTRAVAAVTGRPLENVHVLHEPAAAGRLAFGGRLVED